MIAETGFGTWPTPAEGAPKPKAGNPLAASWKAADPWTDGAWTTFAKAQVPALSAAQQAIRQAVVASAKVAGKAAMKVDVVAETSAGQERFFAFASARLAENGLALADFSMGVAQNEGVANCLSAAAGGVNDFLREHGAAGAIHRSAGRTYAWIRRSPGGNEPTKPEYGLESIPDYGPLLVKSTVWR